MVEEARTKANLKANSLRSVRTVQGVYYQETIDDQLLAEEKLYELEQKKNHEFIFLKMKIALQKKKLTAIKGTSNNNESEHSVYSKSTKNKNIDNWFQNQKTRNIGNWVYRTRKNLTGFTNIFR